MVFDDSFEHEIRLQTYNRRMFQEAKRAIAVASRLPPSESGEPEPSLAQEARAGRPATHRLSEEGTAPWSGHFQVVLLLDLWHPDADENLRPPRPLIVTSGVYEDFGIFWAHQPQVWKLETRCERGKWVQPSLQLLALVFVELLDFLTAPAPVTGPQAG